MKFSFIVLMLLLGSMTLKADSRSHNIWNGNLHTKNGACDTQCRADATYELDRLCYITYGQSLDQYFIKFVGSKVNEGMIIGRCIGEGFKNPPTE